MKKLNLVIIFGLIGILLLITIAISIPKYFIDKEIDSMKSHIGDTVIIQKDTSVIIDYSYILNQYTLSNGKNVAKELVEKSK